MDGIGRALRAARQGRGWSRETLASRAGVSWGAITQIESGRRRDIRLSSLLALARALDVTLDQLVDGAERARPLVHRALLYAGMPQFLEFAVPYLRAGVAADERPLAVTTAARIRALTDALGKHAGRVTFAESVTWYSTPAAALNGYRDYLNDQLASGAQSIRVLGEPVWAKRTAADVAAWTRYESIVNDVFARSPATLVCPYNTRSVPRPIAAAARRTHPELAGATTITSAAYTPPEQFLLERHN